jgi:hypothetical protein
VLWVAAVPVDEPIASPVGFTTVVDPDDAARAEAYADGVV